jgi:hypothetical protein
MAYSVPVQGCGMRRSPSQNNSLDGVPRRREGKARRSQKRRAWWSATKSSRKWRRKPALSKSMSPRSAPHASGFPRPAPAGRNLHAGSPAHRATSPDNHVTRAYPISSKFISRSSRGPLRWIRAATMAPPCTGESCPGRGEFGTGGERQTLPDEAAPGWGRSAPL